MELNKIYHGDCLEVMKTFPDNSINSVICSPPYWQLRDYGWSGQWGLEPTFQEYLRHLWQLMDEIWRILKDDGTVWINLGDTYSTQSGTNSALARGKIYDNGATYLINRGESGNISKGGLPNKCLMLIPHRFAIGCIDRGWIMRNDIIWAKRNGMPESVTDRFSKKHEYIFFMVKQEKYFFDLNAIRDKIKSTSIERYKYDFSGNPVGLDRVYSGRPQKNTKIPHDDAETFGSPRARQHRQSNGKSVFGGKKGDGQDTDGIYSGKEWYPNTDRKNPGDVADFWDITTKSSNEQHFASYNTELLKKPILSGCPAGGVILDPFCGTATTGCIAIAFGRKFIGIEGKKEYVDMGNKKIEPFAMQSPLF